jgi:hypothetical protein
MKVLLLAGGFGTRLSEETEIRPKPMVEIGGKPILWHIMKTYSTYGFNDFVILLGYKGYYIKEYFDTRIPLIRANIPDATYLVWLDCRKLNMTDQELKAFMIRKAGLGLNPGSDFTRALSGFMRLNAACPRATLEKALGQLERAVNELAH